MMKLVGWGMRRKRKLQFELSEFGATCRLECSVGMPPVGFSLVEGKSYQLMRDLRRMMAVIET
jgi:hypothetical protein